MCGGNTITRPHCQAYLPVRPFTAIKKAVAGELHCSQPTQLAVALWMHQVCSPTE